ncbi:energy transducer TonB [Aquimarina sp. MMG016]|uniref:energy transducer TonB n=1 Tax=Aquimarina sp. MMG016 TaxID=2822690 RepID=UPI001B39F1CB|nr:energy transducer TonB [Aquimarina sp. MMG016]MBQ4822356.1 energy transducer TonB [Aquimarina sp. MMG016]
MIKLDTRHKRKSFILTTILHVAIVLLLFYLGINAIVEEPEGGIAVNFGTTVTGSGKIQPKEAIKSSPKQTTPEPTPVTPEPQEEIPEIQDEVVTQDSEDAPVIDKKPKKIPKKKVEKPKEKPKDKPSEQKPVEKPIKKPIKKVEEKKPDPKPDKSTLDILDSFSNAPKSDGKAKGGEGDDNKPGDKGNPDGNPYANSYYGQPGPGGTGGVGYGLNGRGRPTNSKVVQECNEAGRVVVKIVVNREGRVIQATPGVKGTTNSARCLMEPAKKTALTFRWKADPKAPAKQIGFVEVNFGLGE